MVHIYLQAFEGKVAFAKTRLYDVDDVIAQFLTIGHYIHIKGCNGIGGMMGIDIADALGLQLIAKRIDVALYLHRRSGRKILASTTNNNHHLR